MKKFLALSIFLFFLSTVLSVQAACWCADPVADNCQCGRTGTSAYSYDYSSGTKTIKLYCDSAQETRSEFAVKAPICGSSPEILPYCAQETNDSSRYSCYGRQFAKGNTDSAIKSAPDKSWVQVTGTFKYNGASFGPASNVFVCDSGAFGCARSDTTFIDPVGIPNPNDANFYCTPQRTGVANPQFCGKNEIGSGESRLFFPHLRNISALSTLLQTIFNPGPSLFKRNVEPVPAGKTASSGLDSTDTATSKIYFHQGKDDNTQIVNQVDNNSSLRVGTSAPPPLYNFDGSDNPYKTSGFCNINDTKVNPGDDLLGPTVVSNLTYTQKYVYKTAPHPDGCVEDNDKVSEAAYLGGTKCCSEIAGNGYSSLRPEKIIVSNPRGQGEVYYKCATRDGNDYPTKGRAVVYTKTPLIEYIYDTLVVGSQSVLKRIFPQDNPKEFKEIPSEAKYVVTAPGVSGSSPTIYIPHLGSLYEYFLQGLQKALRPTGFSTPSVSSQNTCSPTLPTLPAVDSTCQTCSLSFPSPSMKNIFESAASFYKVPVSVLVGIFYNEGGLNPSWGWNDSKVLAASGPNCQVTNCDGSNVSSSGAKGPWQFLPSAWSSFSTAAAEAGVSDGRTPNICNLLDSTFAAAKKLSRERGGKDRYDPPQCVGYQLNTNKGPSQSCAWNRSDIVTAARQYLGYCEDPQNPDPRYSPRPACMDDPSTCYQRSVLNIATCLVTP